MGNTSSCTLSRVASGRAVRVIGVDGSVERHAQSVRAADIMMENPGYFVCDSDHLSVGCRIPGVLAQEELERRRLYFLLPMDMLYSVLTEEEMASLANSASVSAKRHLSRVAAPPSSSTTRKSAAGKWILPELSEFCLNTAASRKTEEPKRDGCRVFSGGVDFSWQRSWKPALDTIEEVS